MHLRVIPAMLAGALIAISGSAQADHNSKWGEGWAKMPNDIHNTRVETRGDDTAFRDFVKQGNGADSVTRFATDEARSRAAKTDRRSNAAGQRRSVGGSGRRGGGRRR